MPIYDYLCGACGHLLEVVHGIHDYGPRFCPECGSEGRMKKAIAAPAVLFKGSGWAKKDRSATSAPTRAGARSGDDAGGKPKKDGSSTPGSSDAVASSDAGASSDRSTATATPSGAAADGGAD